MAASAASHVGVCCRLPHGITLHNPKNYDDKVVLKGRNKITIIGANYATTMVRKEFWDAWYAAHKGKFDALNCGAIFEAKNAEDAAAIAKEFKDRRTGLEPLDPKAHGVKPVAKDTKDEEEETGDED